MAWSNLKSNWVSGDSYTASNQNDVAAAINVLANGVTKGSVATSEGTASTSYVDLTTTTDSVTVNIGASGKALVIIQAQLTQSGFIAFMSYAVSGANTSAAADAKGVTWYSAAGGATATPVGVFMETGLSPGSTTFKMKYRSSSASGTQTFSNRNITVIPFP